MHAEVNSRESDCENEEAEEAVEDPKIFKLEV
jgi:hypothetical protein